MSSSLTVIIVLSASNSRTVSNRLMAVGKSSPKICKKYHIYMQVQCILKSGYKADSQRPNHLVEYINFRHGQACSSKLPLPMGDPCPHVMHGSLGQPKFTSQMVPRSVQSFLQGSPCVQQTCRQTDHTASVAAIGHIQHYCLML